MTVGVARWSWIAPSVDAAAGLVASGVVLAILGIDPLSAISSLLAGAFGYPEAIGYTLYYLTTYLFAGLAVWIALQAGLFNIGGEGQIYLGGLGAGLVAMALPGLPGPILVPLVGLGAVAGGAAWAFGPALLLARRGASLIVTTIMFNYIASALMSWLLTAVLIKPGQAAPETALFERQSWIPSLTDLASWLGLGIARSPANLALLLALGLVAATRFLMAETVPGYEFRVLGASADAAAYAGISASRATVRALLLSGMMAGLAGFNEVAGVHHRLILDFPNGAGFVGVAVALMAGRSVWGLIPAALLFAALAQGSVDLMIDNPTIDRDMIVLVQGIVTLIAALWRGRLPWSGRLAPAPLEGR